MVKRRGFSLLELSAAGILLAVMLTVSLQLFRAMGTQRRGLQARRTAVEEVANVMERLSARPWGELTTENVGQMEPSPEAQQALPGSELKVDLLQTEGEPEGKRITVALRWPAGPTQPDRSVRLVAWRYRNGND